MPPSLDFLSEFRTLDPDASAHHEKATWYLVAAVSLAASSAGDRVPELYRTATLGLPVETEKLVQRRIKEAILKTSVLMGFPRSLQALTPLYRSLKEDAIDTYGPRMEVIGSCEALKAREAKGKAYFDALWTPEAAQKNRELLQKYHPDMYLLAQKYGYEYWFSEDTILNPVETQMCTAACITCSNSPTQALWHTRGIVRLGGTVEQARSTQTLALRIAKLFGATTGDIVTVDQIDWNDKTPQ